MRPKVMTILGTRPEIIRLSRVIPLLDNLCEHLVVHTGQNYDNCLDQVFFDQLSVRRPDFHLGAKGTFGQQISRILSECETLMLDHKPDRFLVLGDTNSSLGAIMAKRLGIPVYHMEAGNRCYDDRVPEEVNRRIIDHSSDILMPYTERSRQNLLREGIDGSRIFVTGNPIKEVIDHYQSQIDQVDPFAQLNITPRRYVLVTAHRAENVDKPDRLADIFAGISKVCREYSVPAIVSVHPRTRDRLAKFNIEVADREIKLIEPLPFFEFVRLEQQAMLVLTDSGTVQEECAIFGVPNVTIRDNTERPETLERGVNILAGINPDRVVNAAKVAIQTRGHGQTPLEYLTPNVSSTVARLVLGHLDTHR